MTSTVNRAIPVEDSDLVSAEIRDQFNAEYRPTTQDVTVLASAIGAGVTA